MDLFYSEKAQLRQEPKNPTLSLANCYSVIIPEDFSSCYAFCEAQSGRSFHPF